MTGDGVTASGHLRRWDPRRPLSLLTGTGMNTYDVVMLFYQRHVLELRMTHAHNDYLVLLAEGGLLVVVPAIVAATLPAFRLLPMVLRMIIESLPTICVGEEIVISLKAAIAFLFTQQTWPRLSMN